MVLWRTGNNGTCPFEAAFLHSKDPEVAMANRFALVVAVILALARAGNAQNLFDSGQGLSGAERAEAPAIGKAVEAGAAGAQAAPNPAVKYAVIVNGDTESRHRANAVMLKEFMVNYFHMEPDNVTVLSTDRGLAPDAATLDEVARRLKAKLDGNDTLVVYTTGHGNKAAGGTVLALKAPDSISDADFAAKFLDNQAGDYVYVGDQCFSGGFAKKMTANRTKRVTAISSTDDQNSTVCGFFIVPFVIAAQDKSSDANGDGNVSLREAFDVARGISRIGHAQNGFPAGASNALYLTSGSPLPAPSKSSGK